MSDDVKPYSVRPVDVATLTINLDILISMSNYRLMSESELQPQVGTDLDDVRDRMYLKVDKLIRVAHQSDNGAVHEKGDNHDILIEFDQRVIFG
jgi:hypothetical protein